MLSREPEPVVRLSQSGAGGALARKAQSTALQAPVGFEMRRMRSPRDRRQAGAGRGKAVLLIMARALGIGQAEALR